MKIPSALALLSLFASAPALAQARVTLAEGTVNRSVGAAAPAPLHEGDAVAQGDHLATGADGKLELLFDDGSVLRVGKSSALTLNELSFEPKSQTLRARIHLALGKIWSHVEALHDGHYEVETDRAVAGVRGTEFRVDATPGGEGAIEVYDGRVAVAEMIAMRETQPTGQMYGMRAPAAPPQLGAGAAPMAAKADMAPARTHSNAEMAKSIEGAKPELIVERNQHLAFGPVGLGVTSTLRAPDEFSAFIKRARPTRERLRDTERREKQDRHEKRDRRHERLERLRWRK